MALQGHAGAGLDQAALLHLQAPDAYELMSLDVADELHSTGYLDAIIAEMAGDEAAQRQALQLGNVDLHGLGNIDGFGDPLDPRTHDLDIDLHGTVMLDGALEQINEASFDAFDAPLCEGDEIVDVNTEILEKLAA